MKSGEGPRTYEPGVPISEGTHTSFMPRNLIWEFSSLWRITYVEEYMGFAYMGVGASKAEPPDRKLYRERVNLRNVLLLI